MTDITGGPAYPVVGHMYDKSKLGGQLAHGMTLLDHFAGLAMQGMVAHGCTADINGDYFFQKRAQTAYMMADAMLRARDEYDGGEK